MQFSKRDATEAFDAFGLQPAADERYAANAAALLAAAFPSLDPQQSVLLYDTLSTSGFSKERIEYIIYIALRTDRLINQARYGKLCVADFMSITIPLESFSFEDAVTKYQDGRRDLVWVRHDRATKKEIIVAESQAKYAQLPYKPFTPYV